MPTRRQRALLLLLPLLLLPAAAAADSSGIAEIVGDNAATPATSPHSQQQSADPYDEFAEPPEFLRSSSKSSPADRIRESVLWQLTKSEQLLQHQRRLEQLGPLPQHRRPVAMATGDPYRELANAAYYRFVHAILQMRNRQAAAAAAAAGFSGSSGVHEFFEEGGGGNGTVTPSDLPPSPEVAVCPPKWRLDNAMRCKKDGKFCFNSSECSGTECCFDGCRLRCLEPELLLRHVCTDYTNGTAYPGDVFMQKKTRICTCDELGRAVNCKHKKECVDIISSSLFKLGLLNQKTVKLQKVRSRRQKLYNALNAAFKNIKKVY